MKNKLKDISRKIRKFDRGREKLARSGKLKEFANFYTKKYEITNLNTGKYWNSIFSTTNTLDGQSPMTKDKICWIANEVGGKKLEILDLGIGDAFVEELLKERGIKFKLSGLDISKTALENAKKNYKGTFILEDVLSVESRLIGKKFDVILAIELLEHISVSKLFSLYRQIHILLKADGKFILSIPINENLHLKNDNPSAHVRDYTYNIIQTKLELSGFEIIKTNYLIAFENFYFLKKMISKIFINRWKPNSLTIVARKKGGKIKS